MTRINSNINSIEFKSFYFKKVFTNESQIYNVNINQTITEFIANIKIQAYRDFNISINSNIEIIETGHIDSELAPALENSEITIREKYNGRYNQISFYIRPQFLPFKI